MNDVAAPVLSAHTHSVSESLHIALDDLWTQYLSLLDQYQDLRREVAKDIANGHFDLAKANFSNPHRIRYGRDFYDERMQASSRVSCGPEHSYTLTDASVTDEVASSEEDKSIVEDNGAEDSSSSDNPVEGKSDEKTLEVEHSAKDPLFWFGISAPSTLRNSQSAFKDALGKVVKLASVDNEMKAMEIEIRRMRKKLKKAAG